MTHDEDLSDVPYWALYFQPAVDFEVARVRIVRCRANFLLRRGRAEPESSEFRRSWSRNWIFQQWRLSCLQDFPAVGVTWISRGVSQVRGSPRPKIRAERSSNALCAPAPDKGSSRTGGTSSSPTVSSLYPLRDGSSYRTASPTSVPNRASNFVNDVRRDV